MLSPPITGKKTILSRFGKVEVANSHILACCPYGFRITPYMQEMMLYAGQDSVFSEASANLRKYLRCKVEAKQIERLVHAYGDQVGTNLQSSETEVLPTPEDGEQTYVMMDGSMILTREDSWKEVKLGRIFSASAHLPENESRHWIRNSLYIGHLGDHRTFLEKMEAKVDRLKEPVFINDGAKWIWSWASQHYPNATQILDFYHATEYLCNYANELFKRKEERQKWIMDEKESLLNDEIELVIQDIEAHKPRTKSGKSAQKSILTYFKNNRMRMRYKTFREQGLMIGSGPIESANKNVIQARLKKAGQRWTKKGANAMLQLRVALKSDKWDIVIDSIKKAA